MSFLNHIGIAVKDVESMRRLFSLLGITPAEVEDVPDQGVKAHFLGFPSKTDAPHLELLEVTDTAGTVAKFLEKRGPGIHHLAFQVEAGGLDPLCAELRQLGFKLVYEKPKKGAKGKRVNFIHPSSASGILIEILE